MNETNKANAPQTVEERLAYEKRLKGYVAEVTNYFFGKPKPIENNNCSTKEEILKNIKNGSFVTGYNSLEY